MVVSAGPLKQSLPTKSLEKLFDVKNKNLVFSDRLASDKRTSTGVGASESWEDGSRTKSGSFSHGPRNATGRDRAGVESLQRVEFASQNTPWTGDGVI